MDFLTTASHRIEKLLANLTETASPAPSLQQAMAYSTLNGGKRLRPLLVYLTGHTFNVPWEKLDAPACAIELMHTYSLIHDDLPCMDNADLRRGKPTCHKAFDVTLATLAGDALQPLAFEILTEASELSPHQKLAMIATLSHATGPQGMVAGQVLDIQGIRSLDSLRLMYQLKTGALLKACVQMGVIAADIDSLDIKHLLETFIGDISLAFQIQDDLLDIEGASLATGKMQGIDHTNQKITYPVLTGIEETHHEIQHLFNKAIKALQPLGTQAHYLMEFANYLLQRKK